MNERLSATVCDHYGVDSKGELMESDEFTSDIMDAVQPAFCTDCSEEYDNGLEPDAHGVKCPYCHENSVASIGFIILGF